MRGPTPFARHERIIQKMKIADPDFYVFPVLLKIFDIPVVVGFLNANNVNEHMLT